MNIRLLAFLVVLTVLRLVYAAQAGLLPDEAYYHEWSQRLDWWYFSKGPGIALIMRIGTALFGHTEFGVRFFAPLFGLGTTLLVHWLARRIYDARVAFWTVIVMSVTPIFNAGALLMTIDGPSIFFWAASLCTLWLALEKSPAFSWWWALTGVLTGLGFLCKMTNMAFFASAFLLLLLTPRYRLELFRPGFWTMLLAFTPFVVPMFVWNQARGWPTTMHLAARGGLEKAWWAFDFPAVTEFIGAHFLVYSPLIFFTMMMALVTTTWPSFRRWGIALGSAIVAVPRSFRSAWIGWVLMGIAFAGLWMAGNFFEATSFHKAGVWLAVLAALICIYVRKEAPNVHWKSRFLAAFALPLLLAYLWVTLHHNGEPNWTAPASVSLVILTVAYGLDRVVRGVRGTRVFTCIALGLGLLLSVVAVNTDLLRAVGIALPFSRDPSARLRGWREVAERVGAFRNAIEEQGGQKTFLIANSYGTAGALCFYLPEKRLEAPGHPAVYVPESPVPENQFHFWGRYDEYEDRKAPVINDQEDSREYGTSRFAGRTAIYITDREFETIPFDPLTHTFERWEQKTTFEFAQHGLPLRTVRVFLLYRYKPGTMLD
jgi:4-amino-4-deoxy-L-arabinose transferase-like glycosyltransferase